MERIENVYYQKRRFTETSKLHRYLAVKCRGYISIRIKDYNLYEVLIALKKVITSDRLYDPQNPTVILCDDLLEDVLEVKALHVSEIKDHVIKQLFLVDETLEPPPTPTNNGPSYTLTPANGDSFILPSWASTSANAVVARMNALPDFDTEGMYCIKPEFLKVIRKVEGVNQEQTIFYYKEITSILSRYIMSNKNRFFDSRNIRVALVEDDQLGLAFGVKAFARSQVTSLLRAQLIPYKESVNEKSKNVFVQTENIVASTSNADSTPVEKSENEFIQTEIIVASTSNAPVNETTIYDSNESDDDLIENSHTIEFEVDNGTEDECKSNKNCSDDDSDVEEILVNTVSEQNIIESEYWGDFESGSEASEISVKTLKKEWKCITCMEPTNPYMRYCSMCWEDRKNWIPNRIKPLRRKRSKDEKNVSPNKKVRIVSEELFKSQKDASNLCTMCYIRPKDACFVHGQCSHQVSCYPCAKKIVNRRESCPVCRRKIEKIVKNFIY
jgi:Zinc finger, C3HC4 type (RING finger)/SWIB/MDM2 domain